MIETSRESEKLYRFYEFYIERYSFKDNIVHADKYNYCKLDKMTG